MFAEISILEYWKSEHDLDTLEDACACDAGRGLFAVADGAGTTLFARQWAVTLVELFVSCPLLSADPFELDWWLGQARARYAEGLPAPEQLPPEVRQKWQREGSQATLAALRVVESEPEYALVKLLAIGDSCLLWRPAGSEVVESFPLRSPAEFSKPPLCLPSQAALFRRSFHRLQEQWLRLRPDDCLMLATDALARWILAGGDGSLTPGQCFELVARQVPSSWETFVEEGRALRGLADDDCTALVLTCRRTLSERAILLGATQSYQVALQQERRRAFEEARRAGDRRRMAVLYGDGTAFREQGLVIPGEIEQARCVAEALDELLWQLRPLLNRADVAKQAAQLWQRYAPLLAAEPCAASLRRTLAALGVPGVEVGSGDSQEAQPEKRPAQGERTE
ncbi:MAG: hypothetical protein IRZ31_07450 [Thermogemmatispora sp.]|uniref:hypothetical protein n=1 Tax=Thermogemmatispora sp. TaxID=1968838 RepID=UPI002608F8A6|nr:hypothetical protein [Thermogemmatispora sp.]MBX5456722.1 hypothetical protein [Thermogemmatispora sp.]